MTKMTREEYMECFGDDVHENVVNVYLDESNVDQMGVLYADGVYMVIGLGSDYEVSSEEEMESALRQ